MELFDKQSIQRAIRALRCLPLNYTFYKESQEEGLNAEEVFLRKAHYQVIGTRWFNRSSQVESAFLWLIKIGLLRREVDGQGLTSKIRLTPLGRQILEQSPELPAQKARISEKISNFFHRNWPLR